MVQPEDIRGQIFKNLNPSELHCTDIRG